MLESSDIDGGSSVAVLTYLRRILESVDHPDMVNLILHYLLGLPDIVGAVSSVSAGAVSAARKRKSIDLATLMASKGEAAADPLLFNLVDLVLACLRSQNHQTVYVTLQLVSVILKRHHRYAVITLLYTEGVLGESHHRTSGAHQQEVEYLMSLAGTVGGLDNFDEIYDNILKDTLMRLENHPCSIRLVTPKTSTNNHKLPAVPDSLPGAPRDVRSHTLHPSDPLLNIVLDRLETFFLNPVDTNLSLTEAIFDLAVCGFMHLEGWFLRNPQNYVYEEENDDPPLPDPPLDPESQEYIEYKQMQSMQESRRRPRWTQSSLPRLLKILQTLCDQVAAYRDTVPRFDDLLQQRREAFQIADCVNQPLHPQRTRTPASPSPAVTTFDRPSAFRDESRNASRERPSGLEGFAQRILSELGTPTRSSSPRGRKEPNGPAGITSAPAAKRTLSDRSTPAPPPDTPLRAPEAVGGFLSPGSPAASWESRSVGGGGDPLVASQARAFQAIDQSILARRVGTPEVKTAAAAAVEKKGRQQVEPVALNFDRQSGGVGEKFEERDGGRDEEGQVEGEGGGEDALLAPSEDEDELGEEVEGGGGGTEAGGGEGEAGEGGTVSVSHVLTNVIVLRSFLFELASLVQVRAGLFDEVRFA